jgi:hypothetical protein
MLRNRDNLVIGCTWNCHEANSPIHARTFNSYHVPGTEMIPGAPVLANLRHRNEKIQPR